MALEPEVVTADSGPSAELLDMSRRFWIALALTVPIFVLEMGGHLFPALHSLISERISGWLQFALATPVVIWAGWPFFRSEEHTSEIKSLIRISYAVICLKQK